YECPHCVGQELEGDEAPEPPEPGPPATAAETLDEPAGPGTYGGRHRDDTGPITGPIHRALRGPAGRHQEHDLEPKRWPWAVLMCASTTAALVLGYSWGQGQARVAVQRAHMPSARVTVTHHAPGPTVTAKAVPGPTKTKVREVPGPIRWRDPSPAPTVTRTVKVTEPAKEPDPELVKVCLDTDLEEIPCPE
ncbi:hypothetical protein, partial [Nonomuraea sp. NPDC050786]|uniref:hypothetical protein n=1 Tax=Nonomuraea sp. NPDC050786 TaxID=3154840 RepID=UPI0033C859D2